MANTEARTAGSRPDIHGVSARRNDPAPNKNQAGGLLVIVRLKGSLDMKFCTTLLIGTLTVCLSAAAQDTRGKLPESEIALLRADIQTKKTDILQQNLTLSGEQAKTFLAPPTQLPG